MRRERKSDMVWCMWSHENLIAGVEAETNQAKYESMDWTAVGTPFFFGSVLGETAGFKMLDVDLHLMR
jgi:hypothetical protein